jgi:hypothetical protein
LRYSVISIILSWDESEHRPPIDAALLFSPAFNDLSRASLRLGEVQLSMGIFSKMRRASAAEKEDRPTSFAAYSASVADQLQSDDLDDKERVALQSKKASFEKMSDKEKQRWLDYKKRGGF